VPNVDVGIVEDRAHRDFIAGQRHALRHGFARAAQAIGIGKPCDCRCSLGLRQVGHGEYVIDADQAMTATRFTRRQIDAEAFCQHANRGRRAYTIANGSPRSADDGVIDELFGASGHVPDDHALPGGRRFVT
jgi:hypothetical protein